MGARRKPLSLAQRVRRAITNPGALTPRRTLIGGLKEPLLHWQTRAVLEVMDRHYRGKRPGAYWPTDKAIKLLDGPQAAHRSAPSDVEDEL